MPNKKKDLIFIAFIALFFTACSKSDDNNPKPIDPVDPSFEKITSFELEGSPIKVDVYQEYDSLFVGYNPIYFRLVNTYTKKIVTDADIDLTPTMDMGSMKHSCPTDQPAFDKEQGLYKAGLSFIMASMEMNGMSMDWTIPTAITLNGQTYHDTIPVDVKNVGDHRQYITAAAGNTYYLVLVHPGPSEQKVGMNDLEVAVYKQESMFDFEPLDHLNLSFTPTMPSMGHSSPNNIDPTGIGNGHYKGKVNFTMTGDWLLDFTIRDSNNNILASDVGLKIFF